VLPSAETVSFVLYGLNKKKKMVERTVGEETKVRQRGNLK
jgi:hypothetical protein